MEIIMTKGKIFAAIGGTVVGAAAGAFMQELLKEQLSEQQQEEPQWMQLFPLETGRLCAHHYKGNGAAGA
ncbi:MAG: hypothetical protein LUC97_00620 [Clostridiales bacterium]|nr:hypothetical protein [Clostridiales bacterium]